MCEFLPYWGPYPSFLSLTIATPLLYILTQLFTIVNTNMYVCFTSCSTLSDSGVPIVVSEFLLTYRIYQTGIRARQINPIQCSTRAAPLVCTLLPLCCSSIFGKYEFNSCEGCQVFFFSSDQFPDYQPPTSFNFLIRYLFSGLSVEFLIRWARSHENSTYVFVLFAFR